MTSGSSQRHHTLTKYLEDVYSEPPVPREALTDECEILVIGAGFGAMLLWYRSGLTASPAMLLSGALPGLSGSPPRI